MRTTLLLSTLALLTACGDSNPSTTPDASPDASTDDGAAPDTGGDAPNLPDGAFDSGVKVPAAWSKAFPKVDFVDVIARKGTSVWNGVRVLANLNGGDLGDGPKTNTMAFAGFDANGDLDSADANYYPQEVGLAAAGVTLVSKWTGQAPSYRARKFDGFMKAFALTPAKRITPLVSLQSNQSLTLEIAADSLASGSDPDFADTSGHVLTTLDFCLYPTATLGTDKLGCTTNTTSGYIAIDSGQASDGAAFVSGRQLGPKFDYQPASASSVTTTGSGYFVAWYQSQFPSRVKVVSLGGTPVVAADSGVWTRSISRFDGFFFVAPFKGTMDFGTGPLSAPTTGHAVALAVASSTGFSAAYVLSKGPASEGKPSSPMVMSVTANEVILADLIWDWIDIGGTRVDAIHPKGDLLLARIDIQTGKLKSHALYGGPGAIDRFGLVVCAGPPTYEACVAGQSEAGIDFGQGPLPAGMFLARINLQ